ncbi:cytosolic endo-beta-N-acetylglucosaminidase isoform X1 [Diorhabda carinulata]|uniref:cytosolic endo-beta-N-acetylglucosaminidase isoform X1 n=1 Tax=Diorhabda carinulata TaxID=1163345 RepID=UPI0025A100F7|nr:cytosolic endo-beta-N-acetylglucosaminidase isoform X1 [Diorhabda carinulata]
MEHSTKMMPSIFSQCYPITNITELQEVIQDAPLWISRVLPIVPRSRTVVKNFSDDCHSDLHNFSLKTRIDNRFVPKTLLCHDYKGGYQADRYIHNSDEEIVGNGYTFYNWSQIDIFVYFSHHFITIPPLCWINAGHKNGVKVLGTLITEFESGKDICDNQIFVDLETMKAFAQSLALLTKTFGFDGWLLNIENKVDNMQTLKEFVPYFTNLIHTDNPSNLVIWYDSVTLAGELSWQNELNKNNKYFFDSCDGIFLNYTWNEKTLANTRKIAEHRNFDVFVGVDIFGRHMYGGGKFNTCKAVEVAFRHNLSLALFAPGWTHETIDKSDSFFETFFNRDMAFWRTLYCYMYTHPINTYFTTNFYVGLDTECYNMFSQETQLTRCLYPSNLSLIPEFGTINIPSKCRCIQGTLESTKNTCLLTTSNLQEEHIYIHNLFVTDIEINNNTVVFFLSKSIDEARVSSIVDVRLMVSGFNNTLKKVILLGEKKEYPEVNSTIIEVNGLDTGDVYRRIRDRYYRKIVEDHWHLSIFVINTTPSKILEVGMTMKSGNSILLGAFGIEDADGGYLKNS